MGVGEGTWRLTVVSLGGDDYTFWFEDNFVYEPLLQRCVDQIRPTHWAGVVLEIKCQVRIDWRALTGFPHAFLLIVRIDELIPSPHPEG